ncbi:MAG: hypothetical protein Pg6A_12150 [Termitinemataceae bacterium]|nr:MAG: hypothetical protein Pg6A_12150 [Termitinemataceae bacterium]
MQYEYGFQDQGTVTSNWKFIKDELKEGDVLFLRGGERIYAVGEIIKPRMEPDIVLNMADIINKRSHNGYRSDEYEGCIHFDDCSVFYEDLSDGENEWGQRVDVGAWKYYFPEGVYCKGQDNYTNEQNHRNFDKAWDKLINELIEEKKVSIPTLTGNSSQEYTLTSRDSLKFLNISAGTLTKENIYRAFAGNKGRESNAYQNYMLSIVKYLKDKHGLQDYDNKSDGRQGKFVFVIDEINRGEISKIFGELFFSIDPGYRGTKGKVQTQYANMLPDDDPFKDGFYVPENVFIIGTMNDIDRSVESFDFAMRRRFVWHEITAEKSAENMKLSSITAEKMAALNSAISDIPGLNSSYHIGAAYFLEIKEGTVVEPDYLSLWNLRFEPLLREYLRGMPDAIKHLDKLHKAFDPDYTSDTKE